MSDQLVQLSLSKRSQHKEVCGAHAHAHDGAASDHAPSARLPGNAEAPAYWRSLSELAQTEQFEQFLHREFPHAASEWHDPVSRRNFLQLMGASLALAGLYGCERGQPEKIVPYVQPPEQALPGATNYFATAMPFDGYARGLLVESHQGRPIKVEGNPEHPASLGATDPFSQASLLGLYDPDRSQNVMEGGQIQTWSVFLNRIGEWLKGRAETGGAGVRILTETVTSPTLADQIRRLREKYPKLGWHQYQPVNRFNASAGAAQAFGRPVNSVYDFSKAQCILSLDSNFLMEEPGSLRYARQFINGRRLRKAAHGDQRLWRELASKGMVEVEEVPVDPQAGRNVANALYVVESTPTITGATADQRLPLPPSQIELFAYALARALGVTSAPAEPNLSPKIAKYVEVIARDLRSTADRTHGSAVVVVGVNQPPAVHALAHAMNAVLGAAGTSVVYTDPVEFTPEQNQATDQVASLRRLVEDMGRSDGDPQAVDTLIMIGGNPAYSAPVDLNFAQRLQDFSGQQRTVRDPNGRDMRTLRNLTVHLSSYYDETSFRCQWHLPQAHYLESWGDVRAYNGVTTILQPLIAPLYNSRTAYDVLGALLGEAEVNSYEIVRRYWQGRQAAQGNQAQGAVQAADFELFWQRSLRAGIVEGTELPPVQVAIRQGLRMDPPALPASGGYEVSFRPDPTIWDGFFANNGWLQELPKPLTKTTWDNAVFMSPKTAAQLGVLSTVHDEAHLVKVRYGGREFPVEVPVWPWPGHPDESVTIHLGYGRERAGRVGGQDGETCGFNAYAMLTSDAPNYGAGLQIEKTGRKTVIACTQDHQVIEDARDIVRSHTVAQLAEEVSHPPDKSHAGAERGHGESEHASLYPEYDYSKGRAWGMVIDMNACIGCNTCVAACNAENNIPIVGKDQVLIGREMHWIRIDTYYRGDVENPESVFQPMLCQHCENAPCEVVCPVAATTHSSEGINEMTYNRCVGTRYCANNCPYKVRRFNFFQYQDKKTPVLKLLRNPDVTVRERGVMEKCTYCVQRVNGARIEMEKARATLADEKTAPEDKQAADRKRHMVMRELQTACQQSCPTEAIVFGDINYVDAEGRKSRVALLKDQPQNYGVLTELNTQPRTTYLPRLRNPNPDLPTPAEPNPAGRRHPESEARG
jgi:molybdopterin-containing oxidoreductase family iron-sulfur binding subunit